MENKKAKTLVIIITTLLICGIGGYFAYNAIYSKPVEVYVEPEPVPIDLENPVKDLYVKQMDKVNIYGIKCNVNIPGINATVKGAKELNNKILKDYAKIISESKNENAATPYEVSYEYTYEPYQKYVYMTITTKIMNNITCSTYMYDIKQDKELTKADVFPTYGITIPKVKARIKALTNMNIDITTLTDDVVEKSLCIKYIDINKIVLEFIYMGEKAEVTYSINEKTTASMVMDAINEKKDMGQATTGGYKLTANIKLPKIKIDTPNARIFNEKIKTIYDDIMKYYEPEEIEVATSDSENNEEKIEKQIINSYDVSYKYSYIDELGCIYINITKKEISGKETKVEHIKTVTKHITYIYDVKEDKEMELSELFSIFNTTDNEIVNNIIKQNNVTSASLEEKNIKLAILDKTNLSVTSLNEKTLDLKLKVGEKEYDISFQK